jgi:hypothetical protein
VIDRDLILQPVVEVAKHVEVAAPQAIPPFVVVVHIPVRAHAHLVPDHDPKKKGRNKKKRLWKRETGKTKQKDKSCMMWTTKSLRIGRTGGGKWSLVLSPWFILYFQTFLDE